MTLPVDDITKECDRFREAAILSSHAYKFMVDCTYLIGTWQNKCTTLNIIETVLAARVGAQAGSATVLAARVGAQAGFATVLAARVGAQADS